MSEPVSRELAHAMSDTIDVAIEHQLDRSIRETIDRIVCKKLEGCLTMSLDQVVIQKIDTAIGTHIKHANRETRYERVFENFFIFGSRWLLAPAYLLLVGVLVVLLYQSGVEGYQLLTEIKLGSFAEVPILIQALTVIDVVLVMNLILMVILVGYTNFVSKIHPSRSEDWPSWTSELDYSGLKLQLLGSIIAISGIGLLGLFFRATQNPDSVPLRQTVTTVALHLTFVASAIVIAIVNRLHVRRDEKGRITEDA